MKTKKLFLIIALVVGCAVGAHAQKTVFKFRDAQARAGDAVTEVCVKPTVVEVKILEDKGRIKDEWTLSKEEVEIAMKGELDNIRAWGTYLSTIKYNCDVIMGATFKVEDNEKTGGYTVTVVGYPGIFVNWHPATQDDYEWIRLCRLRHHRLADEQVRVPAFSHPAGPHSGTHVREELRALHEHPARQLLRHHHFSHRNGLCNGRYPGHRLLCL